MPNSLLTPANIRYIKAYRLKMSGAAMAKLFKVTKSVVNVFMRKHGLSVSHSLKVKFRALAMSGKTTATSIEDVYLRKHYLEIPVKTIAANINRSHTFVRTRLKQLKLIIHQSIINQRKKESQYQPGRTAENKGKKMSKAVYKKCKPTMFKKGNIPHCTKYDGAISMRYYKTKSGKIIPYKTIRLSKAKWQMLHVYNWEKKYGKVPKGYIIIFRNKDTMNCNVSNLKKVTLQQNMQLNTIHRFHPELKQMIRLNAKLKKKIRHATEQNI